MFPQGQIARQRRKTHESRDRGAELGALLIRRTASDADCSTARLDEPGQHAQKRRLPGTVRPGDRPGLTRAHSETHGSEQHPLMKEDMGWALPIRDSVEEFIARGHDALT